jgi:peroxiredoxin
MRGDRPSSASDVMVAERSALQGVRVETARPGKMLPDASLLRPDGEASSIATTRNGRPAVVIFYRGAWCPFCNIALRVYREELSAPLRERGIELIAISPQTPDGSLSMQEKHDLDFAVLSDPGNTIAEAIGIITRPTDAVLQRQLAGGLDLTDVNADGTVGLPMPTTVILDADGRIVWIDVHPDYSTRTEPAEILAAIDHHLPQ